MFARHIVKTPKKSEFGYFSVADLNSIPAPVRKAPTPADRQRAKKAAAMDAKIARMQRQLAMLARLQKERQKRLERLARNEQLQKRRMRLLASQAKQRRAKQLRLEQQRRAKLLRKEKTLHAKLARAQKTQRAKWKQELSKIRNRRARLDKEVAQKHKKLKQLRKQAKKEERLAMRRRTINEQLTRQEKNEIAALRRQRSTERKRLARVRALIQHQKRLRQKRAHLRRILASKRQKNKKGRKNRVRRQKMRKRARKLLAKLKKESTKLRKQKKKIDAKKMLAQRALKQFNKGSCSQAASYFRQAGHTKLSRKLKEFETKLRMGRGAYSRRNVVVAIPLLERSLTLDLEIGGGRSRFTHTIRMMLANLYMIKGRIAMSSNDYAGAFLYFRTARRYKSNHQRVLFYLKKLRTKANQYFKLATNQYKGNKRMQRRHLNNVTRLLYPNDPLYRKALKYLNR